MTLLEARPLLSVMDTTLRDGEQTPSVAFDADDKLAIAEALLCAGVDRIFGKAENERKLSSLSPQYTTSKSGRSC